MNYLKSLLLVIGLGFALSSQGQSKLDTLQFKVDGVCGMCKERIQHATLVKGVKLAEWNKATQQLTVIYKPAKTNEEKIHQAVAKSGHSTSKVKANPEDYENLPACCAYEEVDPH